MSVGRCFYCERHLRRSRHTNPIGTNWTRDHVIPKSHPAYRPDVHGCIVVIACARCNGARGNAPAILFLLFSRAELRGSGASGKPAQVARRFRAWTMRHVTAPERLEA